MAKEFDELNEYSRQLFGESNVQREDFQDPEGIELAVTTTKIDPKITQITLALYRGDHPQSFMHIGEFTFEYDADEPKAIEEMRRYLKAASVGKLRVSKRSILGITYGSKLEITA